VGKDFHDTFTNVVVASKMTTIPVDECLAAFQGAASRDGTLTQETFAKAYKDLFVLYGLGKPSTKSTKATFGLFDKDGNGIVDAMEVVSGAALLCSGTEEEKMRAVFSAFDVNGDGYISPEEMKTFLFSVYKMILTDEVIANMKKQGADVQSAEDLADTMTDTCFAECDENGDGVLSFEEFMVWWNDDQEVVEDDGEESD
jgi:Ca2+-binding EF-hand superfamily protein